MKKFNLLVFVYRGINRLEEKIIRPHCADYESSLGKHLIIIPFVYLGVAILSGLLTALIMEQLHDPAFEASLLSFLALIIYWICYLRKHLPLLNTTSRKIGYGVFTCGLMVALGPVLFPMLLAFILLTIAIKIALILLSVILWTISLFSSGSRKGEITLDDGTVVRNKKGLFGEDNYYDRDNSSRRFDRSGDIFTER